MVLDNPLLTPADVQRALDVIKTSTNEQFETPEALLQAAADRAVIGVDNATPAVRGTPVGGINLNPTLLNLQIKRDGKGIPLPTYQQPIGNMKIEGLLPVIINITPIANLPLLLGFDTKSSHELSLLLDN